MKEWQTFVRKFPDMHEGKRELFIKDLTEGQSKYDTKHVIAHVSRSRSGLDNPDILWVRSESGIRFPEPWYIKIDRELPPFIEGKPWHSVFESLEKVEKSLS